MGVRKYFVLASPMVLYYTIGVIGFYLPLYARSIGASFTLVELLATAYYIVATPMSFVYGRLADIFGKPRLLLLLGIGINTVACSFMAFSRDPYELLVLRAVQGFALGAAVPLATVVAAEIIGVRSGVGLSGTFSGIAFTLGSIIGGFLIAYAGFTLAFLSVAIFSAVAFVLLAVAEMPEHGVARESSIRRMISDLKVMPFSIIIVYLALLLRTIGGSGVFVIMSVYLRELIGASMIMLSIAMAANPFVQALFMNMASSISYNREKLFYSLGMLLTGLVFLVYLVATSVYHIILANALLGFAWSFIMTSGNIYIIRNAPQRVKYTAVSLFTTAFNASWIIGTILAGPVMDAYGIKAWVGIALILCLFASVLPVFMKSRGE